MKKLMSLWSNLSIRFKLLISFFVIICFGSFFNLYLNNSNYQMMDQFNVTMTNYYRINELLNLSKANQRHMDAYVRRLDEEELVLYYETEEDMVLLIDVLFQQFSSREAYFDMKAIKNSVDAYGEKWSRSIDERQKNIPNYYEAYYEGEGIYNYTQQYIQDLLYTSLREGNSLYNALAREAEVMRQISLFLILGVFAAAIIFGTFFASYLVRPIKRVAVSARQMAEGNLDVEEVIIDSNDEVGVLADAFNTMSASIRDYVKDLEQKVVIEKKLHEEEMAIIRMEHLLQASEFQALQSQVNPHFLFNTLNTISRTAMFEDADDTVKLIQALSKLFRYRIRNSEDMVSLKEELSLINEYIYLQKMRFKERLNYSLELSGDLESIHIPVFMLQPVVENAIIHGIEPKVEGGSVRIKVRSYAHKTTITVTDTGIGIPKDKLKELMNKSRMKKAERIGVANVYNRFKLHFGARGQFSMMSREGLGTMVRLTIDKE